MTPHAHREGHLIFYISEATARMMVADNLFCSMRTQSSAVNPWEAHTFQINGASCSAACICLVLYIKPVWFLPNAQSGVHRLAFGRPGIRITTDLSRLAVSLAAALLDGIDDRDIEPLCREVTRLAHMLPGKIGNHHWRGGRTPRHFAISGSGDLCACSTRLSATTSKSRVWRVKLASSPLRVTSITIPSSPSSERQL